MLPFTGPTPGAQLPAQQPATPYSSGPVQLEAGAVHRGVHGIQHDQPGIVDPAVRIHKAARKRRLQAAPGGMAS